MTTYQQAIESAGRCLADGIRRRDARTVEDAARLSVDVVLGDVTFEDMCARIRAARGEQVAA